MEHGVNNVIDKICGSLYSVNFNLKNKILFFSSALHAINKINCFI